MLTLLGMVRHISHVGISYICAELHVVECGPPWSGEDEVVCANVTLS